MNYLEFKRQLMVDPYDRRPEFVAARRDNPDCAAAAQESDSFEARLRQAMEAPVPADLLDGVYQKIAEEQLAEQSADAADIDQRRFGWIPAMAAGLAMGIGLTATLLFMANDGPQSVEQFVAEHWEYDGEATELMASQSPMDEFGNRQILATLELQADASLMQQIVYARNCGTPHGNGVHMVMNHAGELITVMYIPDAQLDQAQTQTQAGDTTILLSNVELGVIALFGEDRQQLQGALEVIQADLQENERLST